MMSTVTLAEQPTRGLHTRSLIQTITEATDFYLEISHAAMFANDGATAALFLCIFGITDSRP